MLTNRNYVVKEKKFKVPKTPKFKNRPYMAKFVWYTRKVVQKVRSSVEEATNTRLASVWIMEWVIFLRTKRKKRRLGKIWQLYKPKLRVNRLRVIRIRKVCESMRFDCGPEVFVRVNRNYVLTEYVLNENDCTSEKKRGLSPELWRKQRRVNDSRNVSAGTRSTLLMRC